MPETGNINEDRGSANGQNFNGPKRQGLRVRSFYIRHEEREGEVELPEGEQMPIRTSLIFKEIRPLRVMTHLFGWPGGLRLPRLSFYPSIISYYSSHLFHLFHHPSDCKTNYLKTSLNFIIVDRTGRGGTKILKGTWLKTTKMSPKKKKTEDLFGCQSFPTYTPRAHILKLKDVVAYHIKEDQTKTKIK